MLFERGERGMEAVIINGGGGGEGGGGEGGGAGGGGESGGGESGGGRVGARAVAARARVAVRVAARVARVAAAASCSSCPPGWVVAHRGGLLTATSTWPKTGTGCWDSNGNKAASTAIDVFVGCLGGGCSEAPGSACFGILSAAEGVPGNEERGR